MPSDHVPGPATAPNAAAPSATALNAVARALEIDPTRTVRDAPNAFTWWIAPGLRQRVQVEAGPPSATPWLRIETPVLHGADPQAIARLLIALHYYARGAAVLHAPDSGNVALVTRAPLPGPLIEHRAAALAGTGAIQALLAAWAWGEVRTQIGKHTSSWRDALPHPELGMDVTPARVLEYHERVLRPQADARLGAFADDLLATTADAIERNGVGFRPHRRPDGRRVAFAVDLNLTLGILEVGLVRGDVDAHALGVALNLEGNASQARAEAWSHELLRRQLTPGADTWTLGSWTPFPRHDDRPGFGISHAFFVPLALAEPDMGPEIADATARLVDLVRAWFDERAPAPIAAPHPHGGARARLVA